MTLPTNYSLTNHIYTYIYSFKCVQTNDWRYIVTVLEQYLKPFNVVQTNDY